MTMAELKALVEKENNGAIRKLNDYAKKELKAGNREPMDALIELTDTMNEIVALTAKLLVRLQHAEAERFIEIR